ncbi:YfiR family protein [Pelagicoccus sp. SDUM812003]|uniref:YfiR family protein n=1 Tax=Pelagicoccus sp. SDUM812003 TaxID=3041267 RepID=UPI00280FB372|nr:YfiR family protein [Pelagicoccus sp. SDUM812003]MDQ8204603.1 YfiR family protein [Pelagicoccus sp. SDUM812003]
MSHLPSRLLSVLASAFVACACLITPASGQLMQIDEVKANYISGFLQYVNWTADQAADGIVIGVVGSKEIERRLAAGAIKQPGRSDVVQIVTIDPGDDLSAIDVLYVAKGHKSSWSRLMKTCREHDILTIGEEEGFLSAGGCIEFVTRRNTIRFMIHIENAREHGVDFRSKLLDVALEIR